MGVRARLPTHLGRPHWRVEVRLLPAAAMRTEETQHVAFLQVRQPTSRLATCFRTARLTAGNEIMYHFEERKEDALFFFLEMTYYPTFSAVNCGSKFAPSSLIKKGRI